MHTEGGYCLVITEEKELTYKWSTPGWTTTLENPDHNLVNPQVYHFPPETLSDPEVLEILEFHEARNCPIPSFSPFPPSSLDESVGSWGETNPVWGLSSCWCNKEVCDCSYCCPDTPPTLPSVVLWTPGKKYLPYHD